jgi:predicted DNA-binding transcriptional regulator AlpA
MAIQGQSSKFRNFPTKILPPELQRYRLLDERQTALLTGIKVSTLQNQRCNRRGLPYLKLGRTIRYSLTDVLQYLEDRKIRPGEVR